MPLHEEPYPLTVRDGLDSDVSWADSRVAWMVDGEKVDQRLSLGDVEILERFFPCRGPDVSWSAERTRRIHPIGMRCGRRWKKFGSAINNSSQR